MSNELRGPSYAFNECASTRSPVPERGLTFVIRTDAAFATARLRAKINSHIETTPGHPLKDKPDLADYISRITHGAYEIWGHSVLEAKAENLDYGRYGLKEPDDKSLEVHFYNSRALATKAIDLALDKLAKEPGYDPAVPVMFISLDDMIIKQREHWADVGFSRLFDIEGKNHFGYTGRPGMRSLEQQITWARDESAALAAKHGKKIPVVLLEDNVRHAKMLNWVIDKLEEQNMFDHAELAAISTCFCCASEDERAAIKQGGRTVPLTVVIDYEAHLVDVCTPRDLMLDGFVVEVEGKKTRLPGIFMDVAERFKIHPDRAGAFKEKVIDANIQFCETLESAFGVKLPIDWFRGADAIAHVTQTAKDTPMTDIFESMRLDILKSKTANTNAPPATPAAVIDKPADIPVIK